MSAFATFDDYIVSFPVSKLADFESLIPALVAVAVAPMQKLWPANLSRGSLTAAELPSHEM